MRDPCEGAHNCQSGGPDMLVSWHDLRPICGHQGIKSFRDKNICGVSVPNKYVRTLHVSAQSDSPTECLNHQFRFAAQQIYITWATWKTWTTYTARDWHGRQQDSRSGRATIRPFVQLDGEQSDWSKAGRSHRGKRGYGAVTGLTPNTDRAAEELLMLLSVRFRDILKAKLNQLNRYRFDITLMRADHDHGKSETRISILFPITAWSAGDVGSLCMVSETTG